MTSQSNDKKGLERLVARRLSWTAIERRVLYDQQSGALPLRSCTDLVASAIHNTECVWQRGQVVSMLTLDVKGAFNTVLSGRLVQRLYHQGWPKNLAPWVSSFATGRRARTRLDGEIGEAFNLDCGLSHGSPVSPILFMGTSQPGRKRSRFGYADDVAILA